MRVHLVAIPSALCAIAVSACSTFGSTLLPPGAAGGSFLDEARGTVPLHGDARDRQQALDDAVRSHVEARIEVYRALREDSRRLRADLALGARALQTREAEDHIDADKLKFVRELARRYLELDTLLYALWVSYREHLPYRSEPDPYAPMRAATLLNRTTRELGGLLALAAELERLDNAAALVETLAPHHALTRFLNRGDLALELAPESFDRCVGALYDPDHRSLLDRQLAAIHDEQERLSARALQDERFALLLSVVRESSTGKEVAAETETRRRVRFLWQVVNRSAMDAAAPFLDVLIASGFIDDSAGPSPDNPQKRSSKPTETPAEPSPQPAAAPDERERAALPRPAANDGDTVVSSEGLSDAPHADAEAG